MQRSMILFMLLVLHSICFADTVREKIIYGKSLSGVNDTLSLSVLTEAHEMAKSDGDTVQILESGYAAAFQKRSMFRFAEALQDYRVLHKLALSQQDTVSLYNITAELGYIYYRIGEYKEALQYYNSALALAEKMDSPGILAGALTNLGVLFDKWGYYDSARERYMQALELQKKINDSAGVANTQINLGILELSLGNLEQAEAFCESARKIGTAAGKPVVVMDALINLGVIYYFKAEFRKAVSVNDAGLVIAKKLNRSRDVALLLKNNADTYLALNNTADALRYGFEALKIAKEVNSFESIRDAHYVLHEIYTAKNDYKQVVVHLKKVNEYNDSLAQNDLAVQIGKLDERYAIQRKIEEEKRAEELRIKLEAEEYERASNLQYFLIISLAVLIIFSIFFAKKLSFNNRFIEILLFLSILLFFEFIAVLLDPYTEQFSGGFPLPKLAINMVLAVLIYYLDEYFDKKVKTKILSEEQS